MPAAPRRARRARRAREAPPATPRAETRGARAEYEADVLPIELLGSVKELAQKTRERLSARVNEDGEVSQEEAAGIAAEQAARTPELASLDAGARARVADEAVAELFLLGPLEPLLRDPTVTEVMVNAPDQIYVEQKGSLKLTNVRLRDDEQALALCSRLAAEDDKHCDKGTPTCDCTLHRPGADFDGSRVNLMVPPIAVDHPVIDIRKFRADVVTPEALEATGSFDRKTAEILESMVLARMNIIVMGGTGSGKTTLLNALSCFIPDDQRILTVEDTVELKLAKSHLVRATTRQRSAEGTGEYTIRDSILNALRQRPDRIVVGECRGEEAFDMLQAMSTGHDGSLTTLHANNARHALSRLQMMIQMSRSAGNMNPVDIMKVITDAVDVIVHVKRWPDGSRRVAEVVEVQGCDGQTGVPTVAPIVLYDEKAGAWVPTGEKLTTAHRERYATNGVEIDERWWSQWL